MSIAEMEWKPIVVEDWGVLDYQVALQRQQQLQSAVLQGEAVDTLVLVEHPSVVTLGRRGSETDLRVSADELGACGVTLQSINRGGLATAHEPGQLVAYPIVTLRRHDLRWFADTFLGVVVSLLAEYKLVGELKDKEPGVWVNDGKICSFGIAVRKWVSSHGIALNVNNDLKTFSMIVPCGRPQERVTSMSHELSCPLDMPELKQRFAELFCEAFAYQVQA